MTDHNEMLTEYKTFRNAVVTPIYISEMKFSASKANQKWAYSVQIGERVWTKEFSVRTEAVQDRQKFLEGVELCRTGPQ
jgi:hypothetical protein